MTEPREMTNEELCERARELLPQYRTWAVDELARRLREAGEDSDRLDWLTEQTKGYGNGWECRESSTGRGMRLHESEALEALPTPREAIDAARRTEQEHDDDEA